MFMEGPDINKLSTNLSTQIGEAGAAKAASKVSGDGGESAVEAVNPRVSEGATVAGTGVNKAAIGELLATGTIPLVNNFYTSMSSNGHNVTGHPIDAQMVALLPEHPTPETTAQFQVLDKLAHAPEEGLPQTSRRVSSSGISFFKAGPVGLSTAEATRYLVNLFNTAQD